MDRFYMVYVDGRTGSTCKHESVTGASQEAARLARLNPGTKVYVLETILVNVATITDTQYGIR